MSEDDVVESNTLSFGDREVICLNQKKSTGEKNLTADHFA
jgi:hypothetical protein